MTTIIGDDEWLAKARKAVQEAAANRPLVLMPGVETQPVVDLDQWRVKRVIVDAVHYDLLVGYDHSVGYGRVSTPIRAFDAARAQATSRSGRLYRLLDAPGYSTDGEYVFRTRFGRVLTDSNRSDVSHEYWDAVKAAVRHPTREPDSDDTIVR